MTLDSRTVFLLGSRGRLLLMVGGFLGACASEKEASDAACLSEDCLPEADFTDPLLGDFVWFPPGSFEMGCTEALEADGRCSAVEQVAHEVTLGAGVWIGRFEVVQGQFEPVMGWNESQVQGQNHPVETVTLADALAFANEVSARDGLEPCYVCAEGVCRPDLEPAACSGWRLPTEAEWERAARCGEDTVYAGGDSLEAVSVVPAATGVSETVPVGSLAPNACGLYDMSGNVGELIPERRRPYPRTADEGVVDPWMPYDGSSASDAAVVLRGGPVLSSGESQRVSARTEIHPATSGLIAGFRLARTR